MGTATAWFGEQGEYYQPGDDVDTSQNRLHWVAVVPSFQGRGIGRRLVEEALAVFQTIACSTQNLTKDGVQAEEHGASIYLTTQPASARAIAMYLSFGFFPVPASNRGHSFSPGEIEGWSSVAGVLGMTLDSLLGDGLA